MSPQVGVALIVGFQNGAFPEMATYAPDQIKVTPFSTCVIETAALTRAGVAGLPANAATPGAWVTLEALPETGTETPPAVSVPPKALFELTLVIAIFPATIAGQFGEL